MRILVSPTFVRAVKKLHPKQKLDLDRAVRALNPDPSIGEAKVGDLTGVRVYKFRLRHQMCPLAYRIFDAENLKLLELGYYKNFYRDLKRNDH